MKSTRCVALAAFVCIAASFVPLSVAQAQVAQEGDRLMIAPRGTAAWASVESAWVRIRCEGDEDPLPLEGQHTLIASYIQNGDRVVEFVPGQKLMWMDLKPDVSYEVWVTGDLSGPSLVIGDSAEAPRCIADWDRSGGVDIQDFARFMHDWGQGRADADRSGGTDVEDMVFFMQHFELGC